MIVGIAFLGGTFFGVLVGVVLTALVAEGESECDDDWPPRS